MNKISITLFLLCLFPLFAQEPSVNEIHVKLSTQNALTPIYISKFKGDGSLSQDYLKQLNDIFTFDFYYNGSSQISAPTDDQEALINNFDSQIAFNPKSWKGSGVSHVIKAEVVENKLSLSAFSCKTNSVKHFNDIPLNGNLASDRRQIHKAADSIYKALYNEEGVASTHILYSAQIKPDQVDGSSWTSEIWQCDWDGENARQITSEASYCVTPVYLPMHEDRFLYVSYKIGQPKIYIASLKEGKGERLIDLRGNQLLPAVTRQKDKIAFICDASGRSDLFVQSLTTDQKNAKPIQLFSYPRSTQASPTFNPDGNKIAFVSDKDGSPRIYVIPSSYSGKRAEPTLITKQNSESSCPSWSPDGAKLAYSAKTKGVRQIWLYDFATQEEIQLTYGPGNKENPCFAPNSKHIVFNSTDGESSELYLVNLNQPQAIKITKGSGKKHYPTWGRG